MTSIGRCAPRRCWATRTAKGCGHATVARIAMCTCGKLGRRLLAAGRAPLVQRVGWTWFEKDLRVKGRVCADKLDLAAPGGSFNRLSGHDPAIDRHLVDGQRLSLHFRRADAQGFARKLPCRALQSREAGSYRLGSVGATGVTESCGDTRVRRSVWAYALIPRGWARTPRIACRAAPRRRSAEKLTQATVTAGWRWRIAVPATGGARLHYRRMRSQRVTVAQATPGARVPRVKHRTGRADHVGQGDAPTFRDRRWSRSVERGLAILRCFTPERPLLGIADLADDLGITRSTAHRYVITLAALGYLEQDSSHKYRLGLRVTDLGTAALTCTGLREGSRPWLEKLRRRTSYTVTLGVLDGPEILCIDHARSFRRGQSDMWLRVGSGSRLPAYCTAMGKLLLAYLPEHEQRTQLRNIKLARRGSNPITSKAKLRDELERIHREGLAVSDRESGMDLRSIAAPVQDASGCTCAALGITSASSTCVKRLLAQTERELLSVAGELSQALAGAGIGSQIGRC